MSDNIEKQRLAEAIENLDRQHDRIAILIKGLTKSLEEGSSGMDILEIVRELVNLLNRHFSDENMLFAQFGYPDMSRHMMEHKKIFDEINSQFRKIEAGEKPLSEKLVEYFEQLETDHIAQDDEEYMVYFKNKLAE